MDDTNLNVESADPTIFIPADIKNTHETTFVLDDKPDSTPK